VALSTYESIYRAVMLRCPSASLFLARQWVDYAYRSLWDRRLWSFQRKRGQFIMPAAYTTGLATVTLGSTTVTGVGTTFTSDMVNRQFRLGINTPIYTIASFTNATTIDLADVWGAAGAASAPYSIYQAYVTVPSDFQDFISLWDPQMNWQLNLHTSQEELNSWDAQRASTGTAYVVADYDYESLFSNPPLPRYEIWPHQTAAYCYPFLYTSRPPDLSDPGASLPRMIRGDVILEMALAQCARWPGPSKDAPNPYFNMQLAMSHDATAQRMLFDLERTDEEIVLNNLSYFSPNSLPFATIPTGDARWLQSHA
jgi:hypothetical protein